MKAFGALTSPLRQHARAWFDARSPRSDTLALTQRNVYILPTRAGLMFAFTLLVLLVASINYQLNLGYVLTFLLAGSGFVSMHVTHGQLRGLTLHLRPVAAVFAGDAVALELILTSPGTPRHGIGVSVVAVPDLADAAANAAALVWVDVPAGGQASAHLSFIGPRRGLHVLPALVIETRFPLGLFRAWSVWRPAAQVLVYPRPEHPAAALPAARAAAGGNARARRADGGETEGVRAYRRGDPLKMVVWKKAAQAMQTGGELVARDSSASAQQELWLDWQGCAGLPPEARLSRLTAWVLAADRRAAVFGLGLPGRELPIGGGDAHRRASLEALALWS